MKRCVGGGGPGGGSIPDANTFYSVFGSKQNVELKKKGGGGGLYP